MTADGTLRSMRKVTWPMVGRLLDFQVMGAMEGRHHQPARRALPHEQIPLITSDDLRHARHDTMRRVYGSLGADADVTPPEFYRTDDR